MYEEIDAQWIGPVMIDDDAQVAILARQGDQGAFTTLVRRHQNRVFRFILRMIGSRDEALDLTQDTFMKAWHALPTWRPQAPFRSWLFQIARHAALDALRRRSVVRFETLDPDSSIVDGRPGPEALLHTRQRLEMLDAALGQVPIDHREVLLLREVEGLSYTEIAAALQIPQGTVKSRIARARAALLDVVQRTQAEDHDG